MEALVQDDPRMQWKESTTNPLKLIAPHWAAETGAAAALLHAERHAEHLYGCTTEYTAGQLLHLILTSYKAGPVHTLRLRVFCATLMAEQLAAPPQPKPEQPKRGAKRGAAAAASSSQPTELRFKMTTRSGAEPEPCVTRYATANEAAAAAWRWAANRDILSGGWEVRTERHGWQSNGNSMVLTEGNDWTVEGVFQAYVLQRLLRGGKFETVSGEHSGITIE